MQLPKLIQRRIGKKLSIELTPTTVRAKSLFQFYSKNRRLDDWTEIKDELLAREGSRCWICEKESAHLHLNEFWHYDDVNQVMRLLEIHHLCDYCHKIKHTDFWFFTEYGIEQLKQLNVCREDLMKHYCRVNKCALKDFGKNWKEAIQTWKQRSEVSWVQDFGEFGP